MTGEALSLLAAFFFAVNGVMVAKGVAAGDGRGDHGALLSIIMTVAMAAAAWIVTADTGSLRVPDMVLAAGVWWFAVSGILTIFLGRTLLYQSIASIGAIRASMLLRLHPFFSVLLAALILGETVGAVAAGGMLLIMLSFALLLRRAFGQRPPAAPGTAAEARRVAPRLCLWPGVRLQLRLRRNRP